MPLSDKKKASNAKWDSKNLKRISLAMKVENYDRMKTLLSETGQSVNGYINELIENDLDVNDGIRWSRSQDM